MDYQYAPDDGGEWMLEINSDRDELSWLMNWYASSCDGEWEHAYGVKIGTLDNPGWSVAIDLRGTRLEGRQFEPVAFNLDIDAENTDLRWHTCRVEDGKFVGWGGAFDLAVIIRVFRAWTERPSP